MKRTRFTEEQIIGMLKEAEAGAKTADLARRYGVSEVICPLLSGPKLMIFWITKETWNAEQEASPGRDYRQAA